MKAKNEEGNSSRSLGLTTRSVPCSAAADPLPMSRSTHARASEIRFVMYPFHPHDQRLAFF